MSFSAQVIMFAQDAQKITGCPASVALAQWAQESNYGKEMPLNSNNPFGIKAGAGQPFVLSRTKEERNGRYVATIAKFRKFNSILDSFIEHGKLLMNPAGPYKRAIAFAGNYERFIDEIAPIYATDTHYGTALKNLITKFQLYKYDIVDKPVLKPLS